MTAKQVADTILQQIKITAGQMTVWSWGFKTPQFGSEENGNHFLIFSVSGFLHKGKVKVILEGNDTYTVVLLKKGNFESKRREMVYCDEIGPVIDSLVEKNCSEAEYKEKVEKAEYKF